MKMHPALFVLALGFAACSAAPPYPAYALENDAEEIANVVVTDDSLRDVVRVGSALVERQPGGELRVVVPIRNIDSETIQILAQISFQDAKGFPVGDDSNRQVQILPSGATQTLAWTSQDARASDYVVRLSWNK